MQNHVGYVQGLGENENASCLFLDLLKYVDLMSHFTCKARRLIGLMLNSALRSYDCN